MRNRLLFIFAGFVLTLSALPGASFAQGRGRGQPPAPARPAPRWPDGGPNLGPIAGELGVWLPGNARFADPDEAPRGRGGNAAAFPGFAPDARAPQKPKVSEVPWQPWAKGVYDYRLQNQFEPHTRCKPSGGAREFFTPYGVEFVDLPELKRIYIFDIGGPHTYRIIYMDGREHPKDLVPSYYGHSVGHWEGDTLAIDTVGFEVDRPLRRIECSDLEVNDIRTWIDDARDVLSIPGHDDCDLVPVRRGRPPVSVPRTDEWMAFLSKAGN